jgi:hypothetical protein
MSSSSFTGLLPIDIEFPDRFVETIIKLGIAVSLLRYEYEKEVGQIPKSLLPGLEATLKY